MNLIGYFSVGEALVGWFAKCQETQALLFLGNLIFQTSRKLEFGYKLSINPKT